MKNWRTSKHCNERKVCFGGWHALSIPRFSYKCIFFKDLTLQYPTSIDGV